MSSFIHESATVLNSCFDENSKVFRNAICKNTSVGPASTIGDDSIVLNSTLNKNIEINRRNHIEHTTIGDFSYTGENTTIKYAEIGKYCSISWNVSIGGANHEYERLSTHPKFSFVTNAFGQRALPSQLDSRCTIGNDVWIASGAIILRNVAIGNGAVIAAGAIVTKDVPDYAIVAGIPARVIKYRFTSEQISALQQIQWWNWSEELLSKHIELFRHSLDDKTISLLKTISSTNSGGKNE